MQHLETIRTPTKRRGLARPVSASQIDRRLARELLALGRATVEAASHLPLDRAAAEELDRIYRPSALRLTDSRIWSLVGDQLLSWLTHVGDLACQRAESRGDVAIRIGDLRAAARETHRISCSPYCPPDEP